MARRTLTNDQKRELYKLYAAGGTPSVQLVAKFGFSWPTLKKELLVAQIEQGIDISDEEIDFILKEGEFAPMQAAKVSPFGEPHELAIIGETMNEKLDAILEIVQKATTVEGIVNGLNATIAIKQLHEYAQNPTPLESIRDVEKAAKIVRDAFGMNDKTERKQNRGIDYGLVNAKPVKGKVFDI